LDLGLLQRDVAKRIGVDKTTLTNWELGRTQPEVRFIPRILRFLETDPRAKGKALPERLKAAREALGLTQRQLAQRLKVDPSTVWKWERGRTEPPVQFWPRILVLIGPEKAASNVSWPEEVLAYRRAHGLTQAEFGARIGVPQTTVSDWELGLSSPSSPDARQFLDEMPLVSPVRTIPRSGKDGRRVGRYNAGSRDANE
jgi:transcriptional regulator with XRE-family HTH domain